MGKRSAVLAAVIVIALVANFVILARLAGHARRSQACDVLRDAHLAALVLNRVNRSESQILEASAILSGAQGSLALDNPYTTQSVIDGLLDESGTLHLAWVVAKERGDSSKTIVAERFRSYRKACPGEADRALELLTIGLP